MSIREDSYVNSNFFMIILIFMIVLFYIVLSAWYSKSIDAHIERTYNEINGSPINDEKKFTEFVRGIKKKNKITALDLYRLGSLCDYVGCNTVNASYYYKQSLEKIKEKHPNGRAFSPQDIFIINKIKDRIRLNKLYVALLRQGLYIEERPLQPIHINQINADLEDIDRIGTINIDRFGAIGIEFGPINADQIGIERTHTSENKTPAWTSDSQNVHDTNINQELVQQYNLVSNSVGPSNWNLHKISEYISSPAITEKMPAFELDNVFRATNMLRYIENHDPVIAMLGVRESEYMSNIFSYIMQQNDEKKTVMTQNFINNLKDMEGNGSPVCINGRTTRALSSLAWPEDIDFQDGIGILKSGQVIKNEILSKVGHIRDSVLANEDKEIVDKYNAGEQMEVLQATIMKEIDDKILADYSEAKGIDLKAIRNEIKDNL